MFVLTQKMHRGSSKNSEHEELCPNSGPKSWDVMWVILFAEHSAGEDTAQTCEHSGDCRADSAFGMGGNVIGGL